MKQLKTLHALAVAAALAVAGMATLQVQAQVAAPSDLVLFGPASNPGGLVGFIQAFETNATEFFPAFLPAAANVPNNIGVQFFEDSTLSVLSDQLWTQAGFWYFASDPSLVNFTQLGITSVASLAETGLPQDVSAYFFLPTGSMQVQSDFDVPEPTALALFGLGTAALTIFRRRR